MKKLFSTIIILLCLAIVGWNIYLYIDSTDSPAPSTIDISVSSTTYGDTSMDISGTTPSKILPGTKISQTVTVSNIGQGSAWIRVKMDTAFQDTQGSLLTREDLSVILCTPGSGWIDGGDDYYYYEVPVQVGETTPNLIGELMVSTQMGNGYMCSSCQLTFIAQAVQAADNPIPNGGTVADVQGWPEI